MNNPIIIALSAATLLIVACHQNKETEAEKSIPETELSADETTVPSAVKSAFQQKFPTAQNAEWEKEDDGWEAEFEMSGKEYSANFLTDGTWKETEHEIKKSEIPAPVQNTLDTEFEGYKIEEAEISETSEGSVYEFELEKGESDIEVAISANGKVLKKELKKEDKDEGDSEEDDKD